MGVLDLTKWLNPFFPAHQFFHSHADLSGRFCASIMNEFFEIARIFYANEYQKFRRRIFCCQKFRRRKLRSIKRRILFSLLGIVLYY